MLYTLTINDQGNNTKLQKDEKLYIKWPYYLLCILCLQSGEEVSNRESITNTNWIQEAYFTCCPQHQKSLSLKAKFKNYKNCRFNKVRKTTNQISEEEKGPKIDNS